MIPDSDNIYVIDERATNRARRLVAALNALEARGLSDSRRYASMLAELNGLKIQPRRKSGASISVPRI